MRHGVQRAYQRAPSHTMQCQGDLLAIVMQYHMYFDTYGAPPVNAEELASFEDAFDTLPSHQQRRSRCIAALDSGDYVISWSYDLREGLDRNAEFILAYHRDVPDAGGYVVYADAMVKLVTASEFASASKASSMQAD